MIELMLVVAIIGLLAAIGLPKFGNMVRKTKEARLRGNLGALRSALGIYYADNDSYIPSSTSAVPITYLKFLTFGGKYINEIPRPEVPFHHEPNNFDERVFDIGSPGSSFLCTGLVSLFGYWSNPVHPQYGRVFVLCHDTDWNGRVWSEQ